MSEHSLARFYVLAFLFAGLSGCCSAPPQRVDIGKIPPPITLDEQARRLTDWSRQMPLLRATSVPLGVRIDFRDDHGHDQSQNAEGTLLIRQHLAEGTPADMLLLGKAFDQPVFEAGRNDQKWWFLIRLDTKTAWVGDARRPLLWPEAAGTQSASVLRADLVPDLLGLSALPTLAPAPPVNGQSMVMQVDDVAGVNHLLILQISPLGRPYIARELVIDRISGRLVEVHLFNAGGVLMVRSELADYRPVAYADESQKPAQVQQFPRQVTVSYPAQHMQVSLQFENVLVPARVPPAAFNTPDFEKESLKVVPAE